MTIYSGFSHEKLWFSIVMLVYQRVVGKYIPAIEIEAPGDPDPSTIPPWQAAAVVCTGSSVGMLLQAVEVSVNNSWRRDPQNWEWVLGNWRAAINRMSEDPALKRGFPSPILRHFHHIPFMYQLQKNQEDQWVSGLLASLNGLPVLICWVTILDIRFISLHICSFLIGQGPFCGSFAY